jgi:outer membrane protein assembly factor BamB
MKYVSVLAASVVIAAVTTASATNRWPQFRGPDAGVVADDPALPDTWSATENVMWKAEIPGIGWSSPIVWDDLVFVTSAVPSGPVQPPTPGFYEGHDNRAENKVVHRWMFYALDFKTGAIRWERELHRAVPPIGKHDKNTYASETPVTDGEHVYVYNSALGLFAFDMKGQPRWSQAMDPLNTRHEWGGAASPVLHKGRIYIVNDNETSSFMAAFDAGTGRRMWRVDRDEGSNWSTPFVWEHDQRTEIVTAGTDKVRSYSLDGKQLWELKGMTWIVAPTPFARHGLLFVTSGYFGDAVRPVYAIRPGASGDISLKPGETSNQFIVWSNPRIGTYDTSGLVYGDYYYSLMDRGLLVCHDARTGKEIYPRQRISAEATSFTASPWAYNGKIFALSEDGDTYVIQAGSEYKVLRKNSLNEMAMATPAVAGQSLVIRTATKLYRIGVGAR